MVEKIVLASLLRLWLEYLDESIAGLDELPPLKDGSKTVIIDELPEMATLTSVSNSIRNLIIALNCTNLEQ